MFNYVNQLPSHASLSWKQLVVAAKPGHSCFTWKTKSLFSQPQSTSDEMLLSKSPFCRFIWQKHYRRSQGWIRTVKELMIKELENFRKGRVKFKLCRSKMNPLKTGHIFFYRKRNNLSTKIVPKNRNHFLPSSITCTYSFSSFF